ncbi:MAG: hypothetical protein JXR68_11740 [Bacteroidales bacterium]|nr:hypothetical protein [Bacteroidales bacterium]
MKHFLIFIIPAFLFIFQSCETEDDINAYSNDTITKVEVAFETAKQIFYSLPSPVETAMVIENTDVVFSDNFLLPIDASDLYETSYEQAVNLGVYSADLSYLTMFGQQQLAVKYLATCKKLSDELGLLNVINDSIINSLHNNMMNKDQALNIISEQFMNINSYLEENSRSTTATLIVFGGWVEGLYLSVMLVGDNFDENTELVQMIFDQKISLEDLISLLQLYKNDPQVKKYLNETLELKTIFDDLNNSLVQDDFDKIKSRVQILRNSFTKISF